ncbi:hypothetical protein HDU76_009528 [Blyttiomyces sp. JEL0837]|nr:hypothetical protein HDU76_009528 [Blyttiomyces sp. JEL0837]
MTPETKYQTYLLLLTVLPEALIETMLVPLVPFMMKSLSPGPNIDIGSRSGIFSSAFYFPLLLMNVVWGILSDHVGRKPILIAGLVMGGLTTLYLGSTTSIVVAVLCRFLAGAFGGNSTVAKGGLGELHVDELGRAWAYASYGSLFALAGITGPFLGGILVARPSPDANTSHPRFLDTYPYFLPCALGALISVISLAVTLTQFREPTELRLKNSRMLRKATNKELYNVVSAGSGSVAALDGDDEGVDDEDIDVEEIGMSAIIPAVFVLSAMGGWKGEGVVWVVVLLCDVLFGFAEAVSYLSVIIMISDSVEPDALGSAHGLAATCAAAVRTLAPPLTGYLWELGVKRNMHWMPFLMIACAAMFGIFYARVGLSFVGAHGQGGSGYGRVEEHVDLGYEMDEGDVDGEREVGGPLTKGRRVFSKDFDKS